MQNLLTFLPYLACPLVMGLMMWFMMRGNKAETPRTTAGVASSSTAGSPATTAVAEPVTAPLRMEAEENVPASSGGSGLSSRSPSTTTIRLGTLCFNPKVLGGLALIGLGIWLVAPQFIGAALPILLVAACPLSMLLMMWGMRGSRGATAGTSVAQVGVGPSPAEQLAEFKEQLARTQVEQEALTRTIARLEAESVSPSAPPNRAADSAKAATLRSPGEPEHARA